MHTLSKTSFLAGLQCHKSLWYYKHRKDLRPKVTPELQAIFDRGHEFGRLAQGIFPGGVDCSPAEYWNWAPSIEKTKMIIESGSNTTLYEAAFQEEGVLAAVDILHNAPNGEWHAFEVKSTTGVKEIHIPDVAVQLWVMRKSGLDVKDYSVLFINNEYTRQGHLDVQELCATESVFDLAMEMQDEIEDKVAELKLVAKSKEEPTVEIGPHCGDPYECQFVHHCWKHVPDYSIFDLKNAGGGKIWDLYDQGILKIEDIPADNSFSEKINMQISGETHVDSEAITEFLNSFEYPLYYLDFESVMPAIPMFDQSRPYQQIVFQYSLHVVESEGAEPKHFEFLAETDGSDPRKGVLAGLREQLGKSGSIVVYNKTFEETRIKEMAADFPEYKSDAENWLSRTVDLMIPFRSKHYYHADLRGSYSIKDVLPHLVPELSYDDLEIGDGGTASFIFLQMMRGEFEGDFEWTRQQLLKYCELDTLAMVKIREKLASSDLLRNPN